MEGIYSRSKTNDHLIRNNIITSLRAALMIENIFGIFRLRVTKKCLENTTGTMKAVGISLIVIYTTIYFYIGYTMRSVSEAPIWIRTIDNLTNFVVLCQYVASVLVTSFLLSNLSIKIIVDFAKLDSKLGIIMVPGFYKVSKNRNLLIVIILISIHSTFSFYDLTAGHSSFAVVIVDYVTYLAKNFETIVFCLMILMLQNRLHVINCHLQKFIQENVKTGQGALPTKPRINQSDNRISLKTYKMIPTVPLQELSLAYDMIGKLCHSINNVFNFHIFFTLISMFVYVIITLWASTYYVHTKLLRGPLVTQLVWSVFELIVLTYMTLVCETLLSTRNDTRELVNELVMDYGLPAGARAQAKAFMNLTDVWPLRIFVYDMVSIDISLMLKFISVSTTYLIFILQVSHFV